MVMAKTYDADTNTTKLSLRLEDFQVPLFSSRFRFPGGIMAWGTGKTMVMILRGIIQSKVYKDNLGLIVRKRFTDLRDSTIKDFERYTGIHVPMSTKEVTIPGTNSVIMFRHGDELDSLQNINLGWFGIEQAEEFPNYDGFDQLRGRLRRELEPDPDFVVKSERYGQFFQWLKDNPSHIGMVIANADGHNWVWARWIQGVEGGTEYDGHEAKTEDNWANLPEAFIKDIRLLATDNVKKHARFVMNSHDEQEVEGAQYQEILDKLVSMDRMGPNMYNTGRLVHVVMDPGYHIGLWFFQIKNMRPVFVRCYELLGSGIEGIIDLFDEYKEEYGYRIGQIFAPFDVDNNAHRTVHGDTLLEAFQALGYRIDVLTVEKKKLIGVARTQVFLKDCLFDTDGCDIGIKALYRCRLKKNETMSSEEHPVFLNSLEEDWEAHLNDTMRYASMCVPLIRAEAEDVIDDSACEQMASSYVQRSTL